MVDAMIINEEQDQLLAQDMEGGRQHTVPEEIKMRRLGKSRSLISGDNADISVATTLLRDSMHTDCDETHIRQDLHIFEEQEEKSYLLLQRKNEQLERALSGLERNNKSLNEEMNKMQIVVGQLKETQIPSQAPSGGARSLASRVFLRNVKTTGMPEDAFTLMMISNPRSNKRSMCLGAFAFTFQMTLTIMIVSNQIGESKHSSLFNVPFKVDPVVRVGQFMGILFCSATQNDIMTSVHSLVLFRRGSRWYEALRNGIDTNDAPPGTMEWAKYIVIPNLMKFIEGLLVVFVSFVIIVQSDNIIDLLKDFTALMIISETDNLLFQLAVSGYLGRDLYLEAIRAREIELIEDLDPTSTSSSAASFYIRPLVLLSIMVSLLSGWLVIAVNQENGKIFAQRYPKCDGLFEMAKEHFGDGKCYGGPLNTLECEFEGGDCKDFNSEYPLCKGLDLLNVQEEVGNTKCNTAFSTNECQFDGGDCCPLHITQSHTFGNGKCDLDANTKLCAYDNGDCLDYNLGYCDEELTGDCCPLHIYHSQTFGNGICDLQANIEICRYDDGDCSAYNLEYCDNSGTNTTCCPLNITQNNKFGNGICGDLDANNEICKYDNGDCSEYNRDYCEDDGKSCCPLDIVYDNPSFGDGQCDAKAISFLCKNDKGDCNEFLRDYPECPTDVLSPIGSNDNIIIGNGICDNGLYNLESCGFKSGDCSRGQVGQDLISISAVRAGTSIYMNPKMSDDGSIVVIGSPASDMKDGMLQSYGYNSTKKNWMDIKMSNQYFMDPDQIGEFGLFHREAQNQAGWRLALNWNGTRLAIGSPELGRDENGDKRDSAGHVKIFERHRASNEWVQVGNTLEGVAVDDRFGYNIAMDRDGSMVAVAAPLNDDNGNAAGQIRIFQLVNTSMKGNTTEPELGQKRNSMRLFSYLQQNYEWRQLGADILGKKKKDRIGYRYIHLTSFGGDVRVMFTTGFLAVDDSVTRVCAYNRTSREWDQLGDDIPSPFASSESGAISRDGTRIAVGRNSISRKRPGSVQVYDWKAYNWEPVGNPINRPSIYPENMNDDDEGSGFGRSLAMSTDGNLLAIGSIDPDCDGQPNFCATGTIELLAYENVIHHKFFPPAQKGLRQIGTAIKERSSESHRSIFGLHLSLGENKEGDSLLSAASFGLEGDHGNVKVYNLTDHFYPKCGVQFPGSLGSGFCNDLPPYNSEECGFDGGDCMPKKVENFPGCLVYSPEKIGNGICEDYEPYNSKVCKFDGGDCSPPTQSFTSIPSISPSLVSTPSTSSTIEPPEIESSSRNSDELIEVTFEIMTDKNDNETSWTLTEVGGSDNVTEHIIQTSIGEEYRVERLYLKRCTNYTLSIRDSLGERLDSSGMNFKISHGDNVLVDTNDGTTVAFQSSSYEVPVYYC